MLSQIEINLKKQHDVINNMQKNVHLAENKVMIADNKIDILEVQVQGLENNNFTLN